MSHEFEMQDRRGLPSEQATRQMLRQHLAEILSGEAFRGSARSGQFLTYIVNQYLAGEISGLKERSIGIELFGRKPTYDTSTDAIVRVTASDVRKRLRQHYMLAGSRSSCHISLPSGSYIPVIATSDDEETGSSLTPLGTESGRPVETKPERSLPTVRAKVGPNTHLFVIFGLAVLILNFLAWAVIYRANPIRSRNFSLPWTVFWNSPRQLMLVTSDPNVAEIQGLTGGQISLSDYANRIYIPHPERLDVEQLHFGNSVLRGDKASTVDTAIVGDVAQMAGAADRKLWVRGARSLQLADLQSDYNYILLGSPRSNPWVNLYNDQGDFRFVFDAKSGREVIHDVHPRDGELADYVATSAGWQTGQTFALITFTKMQNEPGSTLLLEGESGEGTGAAGHLVADPAAMRDLLNKCNVTSTAPYFQILLKLNTVAGSADHVEAIACHKIPS